MRILIVGVSTRAMAESAAVSGHNVITLDYFGDRDQREQVENYALHRDFQMEFSAAGLYRVSRRLNAAAVVYLSNLENYPNIVKKLSAKRTLLGNSPTVLRRVRDWRILRAFCRETGLQYPVTILSGERLPNVEPGRWLIKPVRGGSGHGIRFWAGEPLLRTQFLQAFVPGQAASAAFVADGERSVLLGLSEQLIGRPELETNGFTWGGNLLPLVDGEAVLPAVEQMTARLTRQFGLRGVNGLDFIVTRDAAGRPFPCLVEINPRYTGAMELVEKMTGLNIFTLHLEAMAGRLPHFSLADQKPGESAVWGKGIVYARQTVIIPETAGWTNQNRRDIPFPGERIQAGQPVCTALAQGQNRTECWANLLDNVNRIRQEIGDNGDYVHA